MTIVTSYLEDDAQNVAEFIRSLGVKDVETTSTTTPRQLIDTKSHATNDFAKAKIIVVRRHLAAVLSHGTPFVTNLQFERIPRRLWKQIKTWYQFQHALWGNDVFTFDIETKPTRIRSTFSGLVRLLGIPENGSNCERFGAALAEWFRPSLIDEFNVPKLVHFVECATNNTEPF